MKISLLLLSLAVSNAVEVRDSTVKVRRLGEESETTTSTESSGFFGNMLQTVGSMVGFSDGDYFNCFTNNVKITVINQAFQQPFGGFFVMTHKAAATPLFSVGGNSSDALAILAEDGDPSALVTAYTGAADVKYVAAVTDGAPYFGGQTLEFTVPYDASYPYLTIASMAINTNDCFVALNGIHMQPGILNSPGYDSGTEKNNEECASIPGPACGNTGNVRSGDGEGFVHIHRGFFGLVAGGLTAVGYDWRNPMMRVAIASA